MLRIENLKLPPGSGDAALRAQVLKVLRLPEERLLALQSHGPLIGCRKPFPPRTVPRSLWEPDPRDCSPRWYWPGPVPVPFYWNVAAGWRNAPPM